MAFDDETIDVLIGGYMSKVAAEDDYEAVLGSGGYLHGAVIVSKDLEGNWRWSRPTTWSARAPRAWAPSGSLWDCSRHRCWPRPRSVRRSAPGSANCCTAKPKTSWSSRRGRPSRSAALA